MSQKDRKKLVFKRLNKVGTIAEKIAIEQKKRKDFSQIKKESKVEIATPDKPSNASAEKNIKKSKTFSKVINKESKDFQETKSNKKNRLNFREDILKAEKNKKFLLGQQNTFPKSNTSNQSYLSSVPKEIKITEFIQVGELARRLNVKTSAIISKLMQMGIRATIPQSIDSDTATIVASEYGCKVKVISLYDETLIPEKADEEKSLLPRPPRRNCYGSCRSW